MSIYSSLLTTTGAAKYAYNEANALATVLSQVALGDNNGVFFTPSINDGAIVHQVHLASINSITVDPLDSTIDNVEVVLPYNIGGWTIREFRILDNAGVVMYTGNCEISKSILSSGQAIETQIIFPIKRVNTSTVTLNFDTANLATFQYVTNAITAHNNDVNAHGAAAWATKAGVQNCIYNHAIAGGTANAITATYTPAYSAWVDGMTFFAKITANNTTTTPTVSPSGLAAKTIVKIGGTALRAANLVTGMIAQFKYSSTLDKVILQNPDESSSAVPVGTIFPYTGSSTVAPAGYVFDGSVLSRTTYADLFDLWVTSQGFTAQTFTCTIASPGVFTKTTHGFTGGERLRLFTTGALPTGLSTGTDYFVEPIDANTFYLTTSIFGVCTRVITTGTQSGTHTYLQSLYGLGDGSTTFNAPDIRGLFVRGLDRGRGVDASRTLGTAQKGTIVAFDTSTIGSGVAYEGVGAIANNATSLSAAQKSNGCDAYVVTDYPNERINWISSTSTSAIAGTAGVNVASGVVRPSNIALPYIIKY